MGRSRKGYCRLIQVTRSRSQNMAAYLDTARGAAEGDVGILIFDLATYEYHAYINVQFRHFVDG